MRLNDLKSAAKPLEWFEIRDAYGNLHVGIKRTPLSFPTAREPIANQEISGWYLNNNGSIYATKEEAMTALEALHWEAVAQMFNLEG